MLPAAVKLQTDQWIKHCEASEQQRMFEVVCMHCSHKDCRKLSLHVHKNRKIRLFPDLKRVNVSKLSLSTDQGCVCVCARACVAAMSAVDARGSTSHLRSNITDMATRCKILKFIQAVTLNYLVFCLSDFSSGIHHHKFFNNKTLPFSVQIA